MRRQSATEKVKELLRSVPLFAACSKKELSLLAGIVEEQKFPAGKNLFEQGDPGLGLYVIVDGVAEAKINGETIRQMGAGTFFGEIALLDGEPRSATVTAVTDLTTILVPAWSFNAALKSEPSLALTMLKEVSRRLRLNSSGD